MLAEKSRAGRNALAAQEFCRAHGRLAGALHFEELQGSACAGDCQLVIEDEARRPAGLDFPAAQNFDALEPLAEIGFEGGAGARRQRAHEVMHLRSALRPGNMRLGLVDLRGVSDAILRLWRKS